MEPLESRVLLSAVPDAPGPAVHAEVVNQGSELTISTPEVITEAGSGAIFDGVELSALFDGEESPGEPSPSGQTGNIHAAAVLPDRPLLILPGFGGSFPVAGKEQEWLLNRGIDPSKLETDPITNAYSGLALTLQTLGYVKDQSLFIANYDWRMAPGPSDGTFDGQVNELVNGQSVHLTGAGITDNTYNYGVDYLGYWLKRAAEAWKTAKGQYPDTVDIVAHDMGGIVARVYIQSDAYGALAGTTPLPRVRNLVMLGVPNRGSSEVWNWLHDDWTVDPGVGFVLSKVIDLAYGALQAGQTIAGPDGNISATAALPDHQTFISKYVPSLRSLLATYDFLDNGDGVLRNVNADPATRNSLLLDLNDGLDIDYQIGALGADNTFRLNASSPVRRPTGFVDKLDALTGQLTVLYEEDLSTPTSVTRRTGPAAGAEVLPFDQFVGQAPGTAQAWYQDQKTVAGDQSISVQSSRDIFQRAVGLKVHLFELDLDIGFGGQDTLSHALLPAAKAGLKSILNSLAFTYDESQLSLGLSFSSAEMLRAAAARGIFALPDLFHDLNLDLEGRGAMMQGLQRLALWSRRITVDPNANFRLPYLDASIGSLAGVGSALDAIASAMANILRQPGDLTANQFVTALAGLDVPDGFPFEFAIDPDGLLGGSAPGAALGIDLPGSLILFTLKLEAVKRTNVALKFPGNAAQYHLQFDGDEATIQVSGGARVQITFGYDPRPGLRADERFFIKFDDLTFFLNASLPDWSPEISIGPLRASVTHGSLLMQAAVAVHLIDPNNDGRFTFSEIEVSRRNAAGEVVPASPPQLTINPFSRWRLTLPISSSLGNLPLSTGPPPVILINDLNVLDASLPDITLQGDFAQLLSFDNISAEYLMQALRALPDLLRNFKIGLFDKIPLVGPRFGDLANLPDLLTEILDEIRLPESPTIQDFQEAFNRVLGQLDSPSLLTLEMPGGELRFHFKIRREIVDQSVGFTFHRELGGAELNVGADVLVNASINAWIDFGVKLSGGALADSLFLLPGRVGDDTVRPVVEPMNKVQAELRVTTKDPLQATATLGFLSVGIDNGTITVGGKTNGALDPAKSAKVWTQLKDPNNDGHIFLSEIIAAPTQIFDAVGCEGAALLILPFVPIDGGPSGPARVVVNWDDICGGVPSVDTPGVPEYIAAALQFSPEVILQALNGLIDKMDAWLDIDALKFKLPFVDISLRDLLLGFTSIISTYVEKISLSGDTPDDLETALFDAVQIAMDEIRIKNPNIPADLLDLDALPGNNPGSLSFHYRLHLGYVKSEEFNFDLGNDLLELSGKLELKASAAIDIDFGFSSRDGFYLDPGTDHDLFVGVEFTAKGLNAGGNLGPFNIGVRDGRASTQNLGFALDLVDPDGSGKILPGELLDAIRFRPPGGTASLELPLGVRLGKTGPAITTTFKAIWDAAKPTDIYFQKPDGSLTLDAAFAFSDIKFELGEWVQSIVGPFLAEIGKFNPLREFAAILGKLNEPLPIIEQSPLSMLNDVLHFFYPNVPSLFDHPALKLLLNLSNAINAIPAGTSPAINLSAFNMGERAPDSPSIGGTDGGQSLGTFSGVSAALAEYGIVVPILDDLPGTVISLLLQRDIDLVIFRPEPLELPVTFDLDIPILSVGVPDIVSASINAYFTGGFTLYARPEFGISSKAIFSRSGSVLNSLMSGFWIGDNVVDDVDHFEAGVKFYVGAGLSGSVTVLGLDVARAFGAIKMIADIGVDIADVREAGANEGFEDSPGVWKTRVPRSELKGDGRIFFDELEFLFRNYDPLCIITPGGELKPGMTVGASLLGISKTWDVELDPIYKFDVECHPRNPPIIATIVDGDSLVMLMVNPPGAMDVRVEVIPDIRGNPDRLRIGRTIADEYSYEDFSLISTKDPTHYVGGNKINTLKLYGSDGKNEITLEPAAVSALGVQRVEIDAKGGDDRISFGNMTSPGRLATTWIQAGTGNDLIGGSAAADTVLAGEGDDSVKGGEGNDEVHGGDGRDIIDGGQGNDTIFGDAGDDLLTGGEGDDPKIDGGPGKDTVLGDRGIDHLFGGADDDILGGETLVFSFDENNILTILSVKEPDLGEKDFLFGEGEDDWIFGGAGADEIDGGSGTNILFGDSGRILFNMSSRPADLVTDSGNGGADTITGGSGRDLIMGGEGTDTITSGLGDDAILGDAGEIHISGPAYVLIRGSSNIVGDDIIDGGNGSDFIVSGPGDDQITLGTDTAENYVISGAGDITLENDKVIGMTPLGLSGRDKDTVTGGAGSDYVIAAGGEDDFISGGAGDDILVGDFATITFSLGIPVRVESFSEGSSGRDIIAGGAGNDIIITGGGGGTEGDELSGGDGDDWLFGDLAAVDFVAGSRSKMESILFAVGGVDFITGGAGDDFLVGGFGSDSLEGEDGADVILGDAGSLTVGTVRLLDVTLGQALGGGDSLSGGWGNDFIVGQAGADQIQGGFDGPQTNSDDDIIIGDFAIVIFNASGSLDTLNPAVPGTFGNDTISGNNGADWIFGGGGTDSVNSGAGNDIVFSDPGALSTVRSPDGRVEITLRSVDDAQGAGETVSGGAGSDILIAGEGVDSVFGNSSGDPGLPFGEDDLIAGDLAEVVLINRVVSHFATIRPDLGANDDLRGQAGKDIVFGGPGIDSVLGGDGDDILAGDLASTEFASGIIGSVASASLTIGDDDTIDGGAGNDVIFGGMGHDVLTGNTGDDVMLGEAGRLTFVRTGGVDVPQTPELISFFAPGRTDDIIHGNAGNDAVYGGEGDDEIFGEDGNDHLEGNAGLDRIWGAAGNDTLLGGEGRDMLRGEDGNDVIDGGPDEDVIYGDSGDDTLSGGNGSDRIWAGTGNDLIYGAASGSGSDTGSDRAYGEAGDDHLVGGAGSDYFDGGLGKDWIEGGDGSDFMLGGGGVGDKLEGGAGDDQLFGSDEGADTNPDWNNTTAAGDALLGGAGDDQIYGLGGADFIDGGEGSDRIDSGVGADMVHGGAGDDWVFAGRGLGDFIYGEAGDEEIYGSFEGNDRIYGGDGEDKLYGQGGNDLIEGGLGDDYINGGIGSDILRGNEGNDEIDAGGGNGDSIFGGDGEDVVYGSDDGADAVDAGPGDDIVFGRGGNDSIFGGDGYDELHGGNGDDRLMGGNGSDILLGEGQHDILYGNSESSAGAADEVDYLYGDFGTNANDPGAGNDRLFAGAGNDLLFGEGGDDQLNAGSGTAVWLDYGTGEGAVPEQFTVPAVTPAPALASASPLITVSNSLALGPVEIGRWFESGGSATGRGLSGDPALSMESAMTVGSDGSIYVVWAEARYGNFEIYAAVYRRGSGWSELAGSASAGGIAPSATSSRRPAVQMDADGSLVVVWTEVTGTGSEIRGARWNGSSWSSLGTLSSTGSDNASLFQTESGVLALWRESNATGTRVRLKTVVGRTGSALVDTTLGIDSESDFTAATDGRKIGVAWTHDVNGVARVYFSEFANGLWTSPGNSNSGNGIGNTTSGVRLPSVSYAQGGAFVVWEQEDAARLIEIAGARNASGAWTPINSISQTAGHAGSPTLLSNGTALYLAWLDDRLENRTGADVRIYVRRWDGTGFREDVPGDASTLGVSLTGDVPEDVSGYVDAAGQVSLLWTEAGAQNEVYLRTLAPGAGRVYLADATAGVSVQQLLDANDLAPGDVIYVKGAHPTGFTVVAQDSGVLIYGLPGSSIAGSATITGATDVTLQRLVISGGLTLTSADSAAVRESTVTGAVNINGGQASVLTHNGLGTVTLRGNASNSWLAFNTLAGVAFADTGATGIQIFQNTIRGGATGVSISVLASGSIRQNKITATGTALDLSQSFNGPITENEIFGSGTGVNYARANLLNANRIHGNQTGIAATVADAAQALGFVAGSAANEIFDNTTGVQLTGRMQGQHIYRNGTGVAGSGVLGPDFSFDRANLIERNATGVSFMGRVQFNRIERNMIGLQAASGNEITHNMFTRNTQTGVLVPGKSRVQIFHNSIYALAGKNIEVTNQSSETEVLNNILWNETGHDIFVANDSRAGYFSDYNDLYAGATGKIVSWALDFTDILDWQADVARFDLHSIGRTVVNPGWARPRFHSLARGDFEVFPLSGLERWTSPTTDAGAVFVDKGQRPATYVNLLANPAFESELASWSTNPESLAGRSDALAYEGSAYFVAGAKELGWAEQTVDLLARGYSAADLDSRDWVAVFGGRVRSASETPPDVGVIVLKFLSADGTEAGESQRLAASNQSGRWELAGDRVHLPAGTRKIVFRFESARVDHGTDAPVDKESSSHLDAAFVYLLADTIAPDMGAYGNTAGEINVNAAHLALRIPDLYLDVQRDLPQTIRWDSFGNDSESAIRVDLYQDGPAGPALLRTLAPSVPDNGRFTWTPAAYGLNYGTRGLRIVVSSLDDRIRTDRSSEPFAIPENTTTFYVNDGTRTGDEYSTAVGSNRNTGKTVSMPKPNPVNVLRTYKLGGDSTLFIDRGEYPLHDTFLISNEAGSGDDEGFLATGPVASGSTASLRFANPLDDLPLIDVKNADYITLNHLQGSGGSVGLWLHDESERFTGAFLSFRASTGDGIRIDENSSALVLENISASGNKSAGIRVTGVASLLKSGSVFGNENGIIIDSPDAITIQEFRIHDNKAGGIDAAGQIRLLRSVVSGQDDPDAPDTFGIRAVGTVELTENIVFSNRHGVSVTADKPALIKSNRIYSTTHVGLEISGPAQVLQNVIYDNDVGLFWAGSGSVQNNLVYSNRTTGVWIESGALEGTRFDRNTIYEPSADGLVVANGSTAVTLVNNIVWVGSKTAITVEPEGQTGFASDFNLFYATGPASVGKWQDTLIPTLSAWQNTVFQDSNSLSADPRFVAPGSDFHLQSRFGSLHGGQLAPLVNPSSGLPAGVLANDPVQSPAIDRGDSRTPVGNEPAPNGGYVNLGAYGGTAQASRSPSDFIFVLRPAGGESLPIGKRFTIEWRGNPRAASVSIELWSDGARAVTVSASTADDGEFVWLVPDTVAPGQYSVRVSRGAVFGESASPITIVPRISTYYVNDAEVRPGDWTTVPGNNLNGGTSPATPKASIAAVLASYELGPGDVIRVDAGEYQVQANIEILARDAGVQIEGYHDSQFPAREAVLRRGNVALNSYLFDLKNAAATRISYLTLSGAFVAVYAGEGNHSDGLIIENNKFSGNASAGVIIETGNDAAVIRGNRFTDATPTGIQADAVGALIENNTISNAGAGVLVSGQGAVVRNNRISGAGVGISAAYRPDRPSTISTLVQNNTVTASLKIGIDADGMVLVSSNIVTDHASPAVAIQLSAGATASGNTGSNNDVAIFVAGNGTVAGNRVFANRLGILVQSDALISENLVYGNDIGILIDLGGDSTVSNNVIYANTTAGVRINGHVEGELSGSPSADLRNNTIHQRNGIGIRIVGEVDTVALRNNIYWMDGGTAVSAALAFDNSLSSDYNLYYLTNQAKGFQWQSFSLAGRLDVYYELGLDEHGFEGNPNFEDPDGADNLLGFSAGVDHGGDDNFRLKAGSLAVDHGDPASSFAREPSSNGGRIDLGAFGNTPNATISAPVRIDVLSPNGHEKLRVGVLASISWLGYGLAAVNFTVEFSSNSGQTWQTLASNLRTDANGVGRFAWVPAVEVPAETALIRVSASINNTQVTDTSDVPFLVANNGNLYFLNDSQQSAGDWTSAPGRYENSGKDAAHPMPSLGALLRAYDLQSGDIVRVDNGRYVPIRNIRLDNHDTGWSLEGFTSAQFPERKAVFDRARTAAGSYVFEIAGADHLQISNVTLTGGYAGIAIGGDTREFVLQNSVLSGNAAAGGIITASASSITLRQNSIHDNGPRGVPDVFPAGLKVAGPATIDNNEIFAQDTGIDATRGAVIKNNRIHDTRVGILAYGDASISGNRLYANSEEAVRVVQASDTSAGITLDANQIYSNGIGVSLNQVSDPVDIEHNVIYSNRNGGMVMAGGDLALAQIVNNTIQSSSTPAVLMNGGTRNVHLRNQIFWLTQAPAISIAADSERGFESDYNVFSGGDVGRWEDVAFATLSDWQLRLGLDRHSLTAAQPGFIDPDGPDNILGVNTANRDGGADDDFRLAAGSIGIDAGDPATYYLAEPLPNGGRADAGAFGNTSGAASRTANGVQFIEPTNFAKFEAGEPVDIVFRAWMGTSTPVAFINAGGPTVNSWLFDRYSVNESIIGDIGRPVDYHLISTPPSRLVYQSYREAFGGVGKALSYQLPLPAGEYTVKLHFVDPNGLASGSRLFDIRVNNQTVATRYDIAALAGSPYKAVVFQTDVIAGASGLSLDLVNQTDAPAVLSAIEITLKSSQAPVVPSVNLEVSVDNGGTWSSIQNSVPVDRFGQAKLKWTPPSPTSGNTARLRATIAGTGQTTTTAPFLIAPAGRNFYVNDATVEPGLATAAGNNEFSGKDPAHPVADLATLVNYYNLDYGDTVYINAGNYRVLRNISLGWEESGVTIVSATGASAPSLLDRHNQNDESSIFDFTGAQKAQISNLSLTGAHRAVFAGETADSDGITLSGNTIFSNARVGVWIEPGNDRAVVTGNRIYGIRGGAESINQDYGLILSGSSADVSNNEVFDSPVAGISAEGPGTRLQSNDLHGNGWAIQGTVSGALATPMDIVGNRVHENTVGGISAGARVVVSENSVFSQTTTGAIGIQAADGAVVRANRVYLNWRGIVASQNSTISANSVFANSTIGIEARNDSLIELNRIYANGVGVDLSFSFDGVVRRNLIYQNLDQGIYVRAVSTDVVPLVANNTIVQYVGEAIRFGADVFRLKLRNNIIAVGSGFAFFQSTGSAPELDSDFNLFYAMIPASSKLAFWEDAIIATLLPLQSALGGESHSVQADPLFADPDGLDNILGFVNTTAANGGDDDNFSPGTNSPALGQGEAGADIGALPFGVLKPAASNSSPKPHAD